MQETDIKLLRSERLIQSADGGGRMTSQVIVSEEENNLFPDISQQDATTGRVHLVKGFVGVFTDNTEPYLGSLLILAKPSVNPRVSMLLFSRRDWSDTRDQAADYVESFLARGARWPAYLYDRHLAGQRAIVLLQRPETELPSVGRTLSLVSRLGQPDEVEQYVRVTKVTHILRSYFADGGEFTRRVVTCEISSPLLHDFVGEQPSRYDVVAAQTLIYDTRVVDAARYYGTVRLAQDTAIGDRSLWVESIWRQLVPSNTTEVALTDLSAGGESAPLVESGSGAIVFTTAAPIGPNRALHLGTGCAPGSLAIQSGASIFSDDAGIIKLAGLEVGSLDYSNGLATFNAACPDHTAGTKTVTFSPVATPLSPAHTASIYIGPENRGLVYTITLNPPPKPGALFVDFRAQGDWYRLQDRGTGVLRGSSTTFGVGSINFITGTVTVTLGALPDIGSDLIFVYGTAAICFNRSNVAPEAPRIRFTLAHPGLAPNTLVITWLSGKSASDNGLGLITGDAAGTVRYAASEVELILDTLPLGGTEFTVEYSHGTPIEETFEAPVRDTNGFVNLMLANQNIIPNTVEIEFPVTIPDYSGATGTLAEDQVVMPSALGPNNATFRDNGSGALSGVNGSIQYVAGTVSVRPVLTATVKKPIYGSGSSTTTIFTTMFRPAAGLPAGTPEAKPAAPKKLTGWTTQNVEVSMPLSGTVKVRYRAADTPQSAVETHTLSTLQVDLTTDYAESVVLGSVRFLLGGKTYIDRLGQLYTDIDPATGAGLLAGTYDYASGRATLTVWSPGAANTLTLQSLLTQLGRQPVAEVTFRAPSSPIMPGSLYLQANEVNGELISVTVASSGYSATSKMEVLVDYEMGVVRARFGQWVTAAGNEAEPWYLAEGIRSDGKIFRPRLVYADSIRFNAVAYSYLPIPADQLGLSSERLPPDGRVPIFEPTDTLVIHHTQTATFPNPAPPGYTLNCGRTRIARVRVIDAAGQVVDPAKWTATAEDLDAGLVHLANPLDLTGYTQPLACEHTIEDRALVEDSQITGQIVLNLPLSHAFPAESTLVSSALFMGDLQAGWSNPFSQQAWTQVWSSTRIGAPITAQYNYLQYPIQVTNKGGWRERWALIFTSSTHFRIVGETLGEIGAGNINEDCAPINPMTGVPYFVILAAGWGLGWVTDNVVRLDTWLTANFPWWLARTILPGARLGQPDQFRLLALGDRNQ